MAAAALSSPSPSLLSVPTPPAHLLSITSKPTAARGLNPRTKNPRRLYCAAASPTVPAPASAAKAGSWRDLFSLNSWVVRDYRRLVDSVGALEPALRRLSDEAQQMLFFFSSRLSLKAKTAEFRARLARGETLADVQAEAFAVVREAARRALGMRHFDVQIIGGAVLHGGCIAEMKTGEGKTLVSTLAAYLNALTGEGVHVVTVNDYLAQRAAEWMGCVHLFLGLTVGLMQHK
ncbi:hypothetical protein EJB05_28816, partial [Eragrostis curvula]